MNHAHPNANPPSAGFPTVRPRRLRYNPLIRELVRETTLSPRDLGITSFILFGIPATKDATGSSALEPEGIVQQALRALRRAHGAEVLLITDECFCEYTDHGHCGILHDLHGKPDVDNDATLPILAEQCVSHTKAGADVIAPSGMMDGMVGAIR